MYLKSLTLKGFKSFAQPTTLQLEPGICAVVGPNGSGKSNVVDALAWVMGEQGAKTLRGGKMEDVIFAGAGDRKALGRAEVTLTIDNSDGALPIDYSEVSVTRRMFRDGASEYEINGAKARLMDIQELLSDSGIGREMHVIVGQGRLSQILESRPEERRAFIEEAAGVLKHRRRKEKAQRKLVNMQSNLDRLHDLTDELRKQLGPLSRQAEAAQQASTVQATIRSARVQLAAHQMQQLSETLGTATSRAAQAAETLEHLQETVEEHSSELAVTEEELRTALEAAEAAKSLWYRLSAVAEKNSASLRIAADRAQSDVIAAYSGPDPEEILARAERADEEQRLLDEAVQEAQEKLELIRESVLEAEDAARAAEQEHLAQARAIADRREGVVRLLTQHEAATARVSSIKAELARAQETVDHATAAMEQVAEEHAEAEEALASHNVDQGELQERSERAAAEAQTAEERAESLRSQQLTLETQRATYEATIAALSAQLQPTDGAAVAIETAQTFGGEGNLLSTVLNVPAKWSTAVGAVLGNAAGNGVVTETSRAEDIFNVVRGLEEAAQGRAVLFDGGATPEHHTAWRLDLQPVTGDWLLDLLGEQANLRPATQRALNNLLVDVVAVETLEEAHTVVAQDQRLRAVTPTGTVVGAGWMAAGAGGGTNAVEINRRIEELRIEVASITQQIDNLAAQLSGALETAHDARTEAAVATAAVREQHNTQTRAQTRATALQKQLQVAQQQLERATAHRNTAERNLNEAEELVNELNDRVSRIEQEEEPAEASTAERDHAAQALQHIKSIEMEARLGLRTAEERAGSARGRGEALRRQARQEQAAREQYQRSQERKLASRTLAEAVHKQAQRVATRITEALHTAEHKRVETEQTLKTWQTAMAKQKDELSALQAQLGRATEVAHESELARTTAQMQMEQALTNAMEQLAMNAEQLLAEQLPEAFDEAATRATLKKAERSLNALGKVNPLALEEFKALEERYNFLAQQLDDVERARQDLNDVIEDVDRTILQLFTEAWTDVEAEFPKVFATLFPGGQGRLVLTNPEDMLTTGIEVEARPPGKKVKRLSLLSGGEKSLTALAMLVAIFRARPSPFYVMDEVEAALDDVNLRRLIALFEELRNDSQLIVITHQKPTMDVANVLYGVTMRGDGVTRVISQRMQRATTANRGV